MSVVTSLCEFRGNSQQKAAVFPLACLIAYRHPLPLDSCDPDWGLPINSQDDSVLMGFLEKKTGSNYASFSNLRSDIGKAVGRYGSSATQIRQPFVKKIKVLEDGEGIPELTEDNRYRLAAFREAYDVIKEILYKETFDNQFPFIANLFPYYPDQRGISAQKYVEWLEFNLAHLEKFYGKNVMTVVACPDALIKARLAAQAVMDKYFGQGAAEKVDIGLRK